MVTKPIVLVGEAKGEQEARINSSFVGASGVELLRMLDEAGVLTLTSADHEYIHRYFQQGDPRQIDMIWNLHPEVYRTNVFQLHPPGNKLEHLCIKKTEMKASGLRPIPDYPALIKGAFVREEYEPELDRLGRELVEQDPNLVICLGGTALWALTGQTAISKRRGAVCLSTHTASGFKLLPTYHPAAVLRQWELRPVVVVDLVKAAKEAEFAEIRRPEREIWIEPTIEDIQAFLEKVPSRSMAVDIETSGSQITCIGLAHSKEIAIVIPFYDNRRKGRSYWTNNETEQRAWLLVRHVLEDSSIRKTFQNGLFDIAFLYRAYGIKVMGAEHDTMLLHHALQPESLKGLGFLGSVYTDEGAWKQLRGKATTLKADE